MIDLSPQQLETVKALLARHVPECEVRAFGSRVKWTAKSYSDLDLAVVGPKKLRQGQLEDLREAFVESDLPFRVDVLDWHAIPEHFRTVISERIEVIYPSDKKSPGDGKWECRTPSKLTENLDGQQIPMNETNHQQATCP